MLALNIIKDTVKKFYDDLFKLVILNLIWFLILLLPFLLQFISNSNIILYIAVIYILIIAGPTMLSALNYINGSLDRYDSSIKTFLIGIKVNFRRGFAAFLFSIAGYLLIIIDIFFFLQRTENYLMMIISIMFFYLFILFSMMQIYFWGLLAIQKEVGIIELVKRSFILVMDNIISTVLLLLFILIILILNIVLAIIMPFFFFTLIALLVLLTSRTILQKYDTKQE